MNSVTGTPLYTLAAHDKRGHRRALQRLLLQRLLLLLLSGLLLTSVGCATVKPWERDTHALAPMAAEDLKCHRFERNVEVYREGAVGANGGKSGGGCGCS